MSAHQDDTTVRSGNGKRERLARSELLTVWAKPERALPLGTRLRSIADDIPASQIDALWVFPPLPNHDDGSEFIVLSCYDGPGRRRVVTAHLELEPTDADDDEHVWIQRLQEHGAAPEGWVEDIPDRLLGRLEDAGVPQVLEIGGESERWDQVLERFANGNGQGAAGKTVPVHRNGDGPPNTGS